MQVVNKIKYSIKLIPDKYSSDCSFYVDIHGNIFNGFKGVIDREYTVDKYSTANIDIDDCTINTLTIDFTNGDLEVDADRTEPTTKRKIYKYVSIGSHDNVNEYILNLILGRKKSIKATNTFGFNDILEGTYSNNKLCSPSSSFYDANCIGCKLNKHTRCDLDSCKCKSCMRYYYCKTHNLDAEGKIDSNKCKYIKQFNEDGLLQQCKFDIYTELLFRNYIVCFSKEKESRALIEKFCGRNGLILEYVVEDETKCKWIDVVYQTQPSPDVAIDLALEAHDKGLENVDISRAIRSKHPIFEYEQEVRCVMYDKLDTTYKFIDEESLGIRLNAVRFYRDSYITNLSEKQMQLITDIGKAIYERGVYTEIISTTDFINGNRIGVNISGEYMTRHREEIINVFNCYGLGLMEKP